MSKTARDGGCLALSSGPSVQPIEWGLTSEDDGNGRYRQEGSERRGRPGITGVSDACRQNTQKPKLPWQSWPIRSIKIKELNVTLLGMADGLAHSKNNLHEGDELILVRTNTICSKLSCTLKSPSAWTKFSLLFFLKWETGFACSFHLFNK